MKSILLFLLTLFFECFAQHVIIDVVIPCAPKDQATLDYAIRGIRLFGKDVRRIIVVSEKQLTTQAEWFSEFKYPFSKYDVGLAIYGNQTDAQVFVETQRGKIGWIYQQLIKFYAPFVIPEISNNVLVLDADFIFIKPVEFIDANNKTLFAVGSEYYVPYFDHAKKLIPEFKKLYPNFSGILHHMLFQKDVLQNLFETVESAHNKKFWTAFCTTMDKTLATPASEYEIYFNFIFRDYPNRAKIRKLSYEECTSLGKLEYMIARKKTDCVSCQAYRRNAK